jgi:transcriptional regulator with PAS, ATPase and Fis domain
MVDSKELFPQIIGERKLIRSVFKQIKMVAPTDSTVLILGESGTGKELVATSIHEHSGRKDKPFVKINCVAIPQDLLESELFGHEKGAFTGAVARKIGKFEAADGGTVFLDEIGDMPLRLQAKLLRVLQEREFERVGGTKTIQVDIRFIAATNKDLSELIKLGEFRDDLYYRLNVFTCVIPPLRKRKEDIAPLTHHFLSGYSEKISMSKEALQALLAYDWPGNVRELKNCLERAAVLNEEGYILPKHLPGGVSEQASAEELLSSLIAGDNLDEKLQNLEKNLILQALYQSGGVQVKAATLLGIKERSLWNRIKKHEIDMEKVKKQIA